jgi:hypothetical protein
MQQYWMALVSLSCNNVNSSIVVHAIMDTDVSVVTELLSSDFLVQSHLDITGCRRVLKSPSPDVLVCRAMDSFWLEA